MTLNSCVRIHCEMHKGWDRVISLMRREFANDPEDRGSIPGRVIPMTQKMVLDAALVSTPHNKLRINGKVEQSREWTSPPSHYTPRCSSYWKENFRITLDYSLQLYLYIYIYIYIYNLKYQTFFFSFYSAKYITSINSKEELQLWVF